MQGRNLRERLTYYVQELERLEERKKAAAGDFTEALLQAKSEGFDSATLKVVLKLRKLTPSQRLERRALEAIYMATLGMLDGDALPDEARRRFEPPSAPRDVTPSARPERDETEPGTETVTPAPPEVPQAQPTLPMKDPVEARQEGAAAADAGKRIYDNPYRAGDPCRAAWDEGWCSARGANGMEVPPAYQRRQPEKPAKKDGDGTGGDATGDAEKDAA